MHKLPIPFLTSLQHVKGFDEEQFTSIHSSGEQVTAVRYNPSKISEALFTEHLHTNSQVPWCQSGFYLTERPSFTLDPIFHGGAYYVQEASSMFLHHVITQLFPQGAPEAMLDLCAAPGGKSTLLEAAFPDALLVSNELIKSRVTILAENLSKWGSGNVVVSNNEAKDFQQLPGFFNLVMVDAPCSGSGLFRKDNKAIEEWSEANVTMCSHRQQRILADSISCLQQNGYLIYSTCSFSKKENEDICDWIVDELHLLPVTIPINRLWNIIETVSDKHNAAGYRFYPDKLQGEGFFIACFQQPHGGGDIYEGKSAPGQLNKIEEAVVYPWLAKPHELSFYKQKETIVCVPTHLAALHQHVQKHLALRKSGVAIGVIKGKDLIPHHELALSHLLNPAIPSIDLGINEALKYLRRQDVHFPNANRGWTILRHQNINLGWVKVLPNRVNNYYPVDWRILKA